MMQTPAVLLETSLQSTNYKVLTDENSLPRHDDLLS